MIFEEQAATNSATANAIYEEEEKEHCMDQFPDRNFVANDKIATNNKPKCARKLALAHQKMEQEVGNEIKE